MMFLTHLLFGTLSGYLFSHFLGFGSSASFIAVAAAASLLPDIDHVSSKLGRMLPPFSAILSLLFSHRGFLHSVFPPLMLYFMISRISQLIAAAVLVGCVSHLLLDAATTKGIRPLHPLPLKIRGVIRTNGFVERMVALLLIIVVAVAFSGLLKFLW